MFPLCESYLLIDQFVESRSQFKNGLVNHAFAAALKALLVVGSLCCKSFDYYTCGRGGCCMPVSLYCYCNIVAPICLIVLLSLYCTVMAAVFFLS
jgi:hypothetical protein